jgi:hypothetical protein
MHNLNTKLFCVPLGVFCDIWTLCPYETHTLGVSLFITAPSRTLSSSASVLLLLFQAPPLSNEYENSYNLWLPCSEQCQLSLDPTLVKCNPHLLPMRHVKPVMSLIAWYLTKSSKVKFWMSLDGESMESSLLLLKDHTNCDLGGIGSSWCISEQNCGSFSKLSHALGALVSQHTCPPTLLLHSYSSNLLYFIEVLSWRYLQNSY